VKRGQLLATLTSTELSNAQLGYLKALSQQVLAESSAARARQLYQADVIGQAELQRRESELVQSNADLSGARDQLKVLGMSEGAIARLARTRQVDSSAQIVSSIDGIVLDRAVTHDIDLYDALKISLISVDSTMRSNLSVGMPIDTLVVRRNARTAEVAYRIEPDEPYFTDLRQRWSAALRAAHAAIPRPPYGTEQ